jgi:hypothetical protein
MSEVEKRRVAGNVYLMPAWLAHRYDELERKKNLLSCHADFPEILLLEHECAAALRQLTAQGHVIEAIERDEALSSGKVTGRTHEEVMQAARRALECD